jgi:hypothetical protein
MATYGLGKGTVLRLLHDHGAKVRGQGLTDLQAAIQFYEAGWSLKQIGNKSDCDAETVRKALKAAGVQMRSPNG